MNSADPSILIVDDMPKNIQLLGSILKNESIDIEFATSGKEALEWLQSRHFDLVLLDIMMPEMDGFEVCRKIKENPDTTDIAVIFITAKTDIQSVIQGFEIGAVDYLTKPFNKNELVARVRTHLTLQRQKRMLEQNNALKNKIFSIIGHDLRNPVGNIKTYIDAFLISGMEVSDEVRFLLKDVSILSEQAFSLLDNLLLWAKNQSGVLTSKPVRTDITEIINNAVHMVQNQADNKMISIHKLPMKKMEAFFDPEQIAIVLRNLLWNAVKFTPKGGEIFVSADIVSDRDKSFVNVEVIDNGIGINTEDQKKLFDSRHHYTTYGTNNEKGSGLGLHLCREFIEMNGGSIGVHSEPGKGSTFFFALPI
ncbi:MAG: hybrid sensor histidine kinase/response regulator [Bacteroidales bacterium]|nr:hybrid sensor histidine kinase/response regulator [Bacteroidales bacterium]